MKTLIFLIDVAINFYMNTIFFKLVLMVIRGSVEESKLLGYYSYGQKPILPKPTEFLIPAIQVEKAVGWPNGKIPTQSPKIKIVPMAKNLDHPRWLYVLHNNGLLVAETDAPSSQESGGINNW